MNYDQSFSTFGQVIIFYTYYYFCLLFFFEAVQSFFKNGNSDQFKLILFLQYLCIFIYFPFTNFLAIFKALIFFSLLIVLLPCTIICIFVLQYTTVTNIHYLLSILEYLSYLFDPLTNPVPSHWVDTDIVIVPLRKPKHRKVKWPGSDNWQTGTKISTLIPTLSSPV